MIIATTPNLSNRLPSVAFYLGLAPLARFWRSRSSNTFVQHHYTQAMASAFFLLILFLAACLYDTGECLFLIYFPDFARQLINEWGFLLAYLDYATWLPIIIVVALWITLLGLAITGSTWQVPLLKRLARRPRVVQLSFVANSFILAIVPLTTVLALHATSLTRTSGFGASVYFLFDEGISVPRWGFALGLYRITLQAQQNWGKGCTVLDRLTKDTLHEALANGKVVILATHGNDGCSCCRNRDPATPAITRHHPAVYARQEYQRPQHTQIN